MGKHHVPEVIPARKPRRATPEVPPHAAPTADDERLRRIGQNIGALIQVAAFQKKRLARLAPAYADRCARVVELKRELKRAHWEIDTLRRRK